MVLEYHPPEESRAREKYTFFILVITSEESLGAAEQVLCCEVEAWYIYEGRGISTMFYIHFLLFFP